MDIDGCHRLPLGRSIANTAKRAIFKLANKKHSEAMLQQKGILMWKVRFLKVIHYACTIISLWKCKDLQK